MKIIIVYGSKRGVTLAMAEKISSVLKENSYENDLYSAALLPPKRLLDYDIILLGSSTWADGDLQSDFIEFEREMDELDLSGKWGAAFGSGSTRFRFFCEAVEILQARLKSCGARRLVKPLKCDEYQKSQIEDAEIWAREIVKKLSKLQL